MNDIIEIGNVVEETKASEKGDFSDTVHPTTSDL